MRFLNSSIFSSVALGLVLSLSAVSAPSVFADSPAPTETSHASEEHAHAAGDHADHAHDDHGDHAAHGDDHGDHEANLNPLQFNFGEAFWNLLVFVILLALLAKFVLPAIRDGLNAREQKLRGDLQAAEQAKADAEKSMDDYKTQLAEARKEAQSIVAEARATAQQAANADKAKIEAEMQQMKENAKRDIAAAREQAMSDIYTQAAGLSTSIAGKILRREINADDQQSLVSESVEQFKSNTSSN